MLLWCYNIWFIQEKRSKINLSWSLNISIAPCCPGKGQFPFRYPRLSHVHIHHLCCGGLVCLCKEPIHLKARKKACMCEQSAFGSLVGLLGHSHTDGSRRGKGQWDRRGKGQHSGAFISLSWVPFFFRLQSICWRFFSIMNIVGVVIFLLSTWLLITLWLPNGNKFLPGWELKKYLETKGMLLISAILEASVL